MKPNYLVSRCSERSLILLSMVIGLTACGPDNDFLDQLDPEPNIEQANPEQINTLDPQPYSESSVSPIPTPGSEPEQVATPEPVSVTPITFVAEDSSCSASPELLKASLLELTNESRGTAQVCGSELHQAVSALEWDDSLAAAARNHSIDMATHNFFNHTGSDGSSSFSRATAQGFPSRAVGENIAAGQRTTGSAQSGWIESAGHCRNIMYSNYTHMGASCIENSDTDFQRYWTVVFGRQ